MKLEIEIPNAAAAVLQKLAESADLGDVQMLAQELLSRAYAGVVRPASWERDWLSHCVSSEAIDKAHLVSMEVT